MSGVVFPMPIFDPSFSIDRITEIIDSVRTRMVFARGKETSGFGADILGQKSIRRGMICMEEILFIKSSASSRALVLIDRIETATTWRTVLSIKIFDIEKFAIKGAWSIDCSATMLMKTDMAVPILLFFNVKNNVVKEEINFDDDSRSNRGFEYRIQL